MKKKSVKDTRVEQLWRRWRSRYDWGPDRGPEPYHTDFTLLMGFPLPRHVPVPLLSQPPCISFQHFLAVGCLSSPFASKLQEDRTIFCAPPTTLPSTEPGGLRKLQQLWLQSSCPLSCCVFEPPWGSPLHSVVPLSSADNANGTPGAGSSLLSSPPMLLLL